MCIYTVKKTKIKKKKSCTPPNVSKFDVSGVEDAAKKYKRFRHVMLHTCR